MRERGVVDDDLVADLGHGAVAPRLRRLERLAVDADVLARRDWKAELEGRVAQRTLEHRLNLFRPTLLGELGREPSRRRRQPRPQQPVEERERQREHRRQQRPVHHPRRLGREDADGDLQGEGGDQRAGGDTIGFSATRRAGDAAPAADQQDGNRNREQACGDAVDREQHVRERLRGKRLEEVLRTCRARTRTTDVPFVEEQPDEGKHPDDDASTRRRPARPASSAPSETRAGGARGTDEEPVEHEPKGEEERGLGTRQRGEPPKPDEDQEDAGPVLRTSRPRDEPLAMKASPVGTASAIVGASPVTWSLVMTAVMAPAAAGARASRPRRCS